MLALRAPEWSQRRGRAVRGAVRLLVQAVLVVATLTLLTFVTVETSQACSTKTNPTARVTQDAPQMVAKHDVITNRWVTATSIVNFAIKETGCCGKESGHCYGRACVGSCCPVCSVGFAVVGWTVDQSIILNADIPLAQIPLSSTELDTQFRPPRELL